MQGIGAEHFTMQRIGIACLFFLHTCVYPKVLSDGVLPIRLNGGSSPHQGRVEVFHDGEWGTVCDDGFTNNVCNILCKQLGYGSEGVCINEDGSHGCQRNDGTIFGESAAKIWIDELICEGSETSIDECRKSHWGVTNCGHKEDAGCICNQITTATSGWCEKSRHRITPFDQGNPNMGRVEIQDESKQWGLVCDDDWDDIDASVFCDCLGYTGRHSFRAFLYPSHNSSLPMLYNAVHCKPQDTASTKNLWDCDVVKAGKGQCDPNMEAAGVMCGSQPAWLPPVIPDVAMSCDGQWLSGCFAAETSAMSEDHYFLTPTCSNAAISKNANDSVCFNIDMSTCVASHTKINISTKHYCHDITYSKSGNSSTQLLTESIWTRRLCCIVAKNGTAVGSFLPQMVAPPPVYRENSEVNNFTMTCYRDFLEESKALDFPATVQRGEPVSCYISVKTWDPQLYMVVSDCKFMTALDNSGPHFYFFRDKCPTTDDLGLVFFSTDYHRWGFKFNVPKFQTYDELYLSCDLYLCDTKQEIKPYCDRSCSTTHDVAQDLSRVKRVAGRRASRTKNSISDKRENGHVERGPFVVENDGAGPLFNNLGQLFIATANKTGLQWVKGVSQKVEEQANAIPVMLTGHASRAFASLWIIASISLFI